MTFTSAIRTLAVSMTAAFIFAAPFFALPATAQDRRAMREHEYERARFQTQHWVWDDRFHHNHYYPSVGYAVPALPAGHLSVMYRGGRYYFHSGVWFQLSGPRYVVVRPPIGLIIPAMPVGYTTIWAGRVPYYYANDVYYVSTPNGYVVSNPPADVNWQDPVPQPAAPPAAGAGPGNSGQPAPGVWYYCASAKGYYPYVTACSEGWRTVPAAPPPMQ